VFACLCYLMQLTQKLLRCGSRTTFDTTLQTIRNDYPTFFTYLQSNWLPHTALFAGFERRGVFHMDNHTNNRLERYHYTIKSVVRSSQVSVGTLVDRLQQIVKVRCVGLLHSDFNRRLKSAASHPVVKQYEPVMSEFACSIITTAVIQADTMTGSFVDNPDGSISFGPAVLTSANSCSCSKYSSYRLPCKHIFYLRKHQGLPAYDQSLCHARWSMSTEHATTNVDEQHNINVSFSDVAPRQETKGQRFKAVMTVFSSMASVLADLPPHRFDKCMRWVSSLEAQVRNGTWEYHNMYHNRSSGSGSVMAVVFRQIVLYCLT